MCSLSAFYPAAAARPQPAAAQRRGFHKVLKGFASSLRFPPRFALTTNGVSVVCASCERALGGSIGRVTRRQGEWVAYVGCDIFAAHSAKRLAMTSRQVQWRRFTFFDKDTIAEDIVSELGAEVSCMHTAGGRLYLGKSSDSASARIRTVKEPRPLEGGGYLSERYSR